MTILHHGSRCFVTGCFYSEDLHIRPALDNRNIADVVAKVNDTSVIKDCGLFIES
jgi:hypothetical protein